MKKLILALLLLSFPAYATLTPPNSGGGGGGSWGSITGTITDQTDLNTELNSKWSLGGNSGTGGTGVVGTSDAQPWTTVANGIFVDAYQIDGQVSSILNYTPIDGVSFNQKRNQVNLNPDVGTSTANFSNLSTAVSFDGSNLGYGYGGNIVGVTSDVSHTGDGSVNFISGQSANLYFTNDGTTNSVKGMNLNTGVDGPYVINAYTGIGSYLNATSLSGGGRLFEGGGSISNSSLNSIDFIGGNVNVNGASVLSGNLNGTGISVSLADTSTANQVIGSSFAAEVRDSAITGGMIGSQLNIQARDASTVNGNVIGVGTGISMDTTAAVQGILGSNTFVQMNDDASGGNIAILNAGITLQDDSIASSAVGLNMNVQLQNNNVVPNVNGGIVNVNVAGTSDVDNLNGFTIDAVAQGSSTIENFTGLRVTPRTDGTAVLANTLQGMEINPSAPVGAEVTQAQGLKVNMNSVNLTSAALAAGAMKVGLSVEDGTINAGYGYTIPTAASFFQTHYIGGNVVVAASNPVAAFGFGTNLAQGVILHDDWALDGSGLGYIDVGFVGAISVDSGKTMAKWTGALGGAGNPAESGTLTDAIMFRAAGILPQGGSLAITNMYGFQVDPTLFCLVGTNCWGIYEDGSSMVENHLSKLAIGTSTKKVGSGALLDVNGRGDFSGGARLSTSGSQPTCDAAHRGLMWNIEGGTGVADDFQVCLKDASDNYNWVSK